MAMNRVQFQPGLSMIEFLARYGSEDKCEAALVESRWPKGFACPACNSGVHSAFVRAARRYWQCAACRHQCSAISGTIFESTKLPLTRWFLAMHLLTQSKNNVSALELKRQPGRLLQERLAHEAQDNGSHAPARGGAACSRGAWRSTTPTWVASAPAARAGAARR